MLLMLIVLIVLLYQAAWRYWLPGLFAPSGDYYTVDPVTGRKIYRRKKSNTKTLSSGETVRTYVPFHSIPHFLWVSSSSS
jgi:membrane peptidoglycan carboxypeptidase